MTIFKLMTFDKYAKLAEILGENGHFELCPLNFAISSDRSDSSLAASILHASENLLKIADILGVEASSLTFKFNSDESDHELASHDLDLSLPISTGSYVLFKNQLCEIEKEEDGVYHLKTVEGNEPLMAGYSALSKTNWGKVFLVRDNVDPELIY